MLLCKFYRQDLYGRAFHRLQHELRRKLNRTLWRREQVKYLLERKESTTGPTNKSRCLGLRADGMLYVSCTTLMTFIGWLQQLTQCSEGTTGRALPNGYNGGNTVAGCIGACNTAGYTFSGVEYGGECCMCIYDNIALLKLIYSRVWFRNHQWGNHCTRWTRRL